VTTVADAFAIYRNPAFGLHAFRAELETLPPDDRGTITVGRAAAEYDPWVRDLYALIDDPAKRYVMIVGPRGCGKSQIGGQVGVERVALRRNHRVIVWAHDLAQAGHIVAAAQGIVRRNPILRREIELVKHGIRCQATGSEMIAVPADAPGAYGFGGPDTTILADEFSTWRSRELADAILSTVEKNPRSQAILFSNAGTIGTVAWDLYRQFETSDDPAVALKMIDYANTRPSWINEGAIERQRKLLTAREFARLWQGSWLSGESLAFPWEDIQACLVEQTERTGDVVLGIDYGKLHDYSAAVGLDLCTGSVIEVRRRRKMDYGAWNNEVASLAKTLAYPPIVADATGVGEAALDGLCAILPRYQRYRHSDLEASGQARVLGRAIYGVSLTSQWKLEAVRKLQLDIEKHRLRIPRSETELIAELREFQETLTSTGLPRFGNPSGAEKHDDLVIALCMANFVATEAARATADPILRRLAALDQKELISAVYAGFGCPPDQHLRNVRDSARLRRRFELGLISHEEYDRLASKELVWSGWTNVWQELGLRE
jgi:hypothetical protein